MPRYGRSKKPSIDQQVFYVSNQMPGLTRIKYVPNKLTAWEGTLQPAPFSKKYKVRIQYEAGSRPDVTLPELDFSTERPPHLFKDNTLCLYSRRGLGAWNPSMPITNLVPMIAHWLWCYELWQVTNKWYGEEFPHDLNEKKEK